MSTLVRERYGPSLPALLERRGIARRTSAIAAIVVVVLFAVLARILSDDGLDQIIVRGDGPTFNVLYDPAVVARPPLKGDERLHLRTQRRRPLALDFTVRPLQLPAYRGDITSGYMPTFAEQIKRERQAADPTFQLLFEGKARFNRAPGYQLGYRTGTPGAYVFFNEVFLVPDPEKDRVGVTLLLRQQRRGVVHKAARKRANAVKKAFRSFRFGTERA